ncbi:hypothetical protein FOMPIDRAFT_91948 [Fomitopsis schrenkii]|uniref:Uncharacterized protein n=1 Tax=Fomitopsis schrenkii TaxID=2126942 RepID=S8DZN8_FOMSC|nr:hypothetical protein FOMPIDRAFT_91948 [Fomitopsis schrenkii]
MSTSNTPNPELEILELKCKLAAARVKAEANQVAMEEHTKHKVEEVEQRQKEEEAERALEATDVARTKAAGKAQAKLGLSEGTYARAENTCVQCSGKGLACFRPSTGLKKVCRKCTVEKTQCDWPREPVKKRRVNTSAKAGKKTAEEINDSNTYNEPEVSPSKERKRAMKQGKESAEAVPAPLLGTGARWSARPEEEMSDCELILRLLTEVQELWVDLRKEQALRKTLESKLKRHEVHNVVIKDYMDKVAEELGEMETEWEGSESESESESEESEESE